MQYYLVKYKTTLAIIDETVALGSVGSIALNKSNKNIQTTLAKQLGVSPHQIIKTQKVFGKIKSDIKNDDLQLVLLSLQNGNAVGENLIDVFYDVIKDLYADVNLSNKIKLFKNQGLTIAQILARFNVDIVIVAIIQSGLRANFNEAVASAISYIKLLEKSKKATKTGFVKSLAYIFIGISMLTVAPTIFAEIILEISQSLSVELTDGVLLLTLWIAAHTVSIYIFLAIIAITLFTVFNNKQVFNAVKDYFPFSIFDRINKLKESIVFLPFYQALNRAGVTDGDIMKSYQQINSSIATQSLIKIERGSTLADSLMHLLDDSFVKRFKQITSITDLNLKHTVSQTVIGLLEHQIITDSKKISKILNTLGYALIGLSVMLVASIYLGIMGLTSSI